MASNKYKILIVEDDEKIGSFLNALLEANDYQVVLAETCGLAKMMFNSHQPDLVVLDLGLPDEDGTVFVRDIIRRFRLLYCRRETVRKIK